jgi:hypothetical protein
MNDVLFKSYGATGVAAYTSTGRPHRLLCFARVAMVPRGGGSAGLTAWQTPRPTPQARGGEGGGAVSPLVMAVDMLDAASAAASPALRSLLRPLQQLTTTAAAAAAGGGGGGGGPPPVSPGGVLPGIRVVFLRRLPGVSASRVILNEGCLLACLHTAGMETQVCVCVLCDPPLPSRLLLLSPCAVCPVCDIPLCAVCPVVCCCRTSCGLCPLNR